jgi:hypothetical protein
MKDKKKKIYIYIYRNKIKKKIMKLLEKKLLNNLYNTDYR